MLHLLTLVPGLRLLHDLERCTAVLLLPCGLWVELDADAAEALSDADAEAIAAAIAVAVAADATGEHRLEMSGRQTVLRKFW